MVVLPAPFAGAIELFADCFYDWLKAVGERTSECAEALRHLSVWPHLSMPGGTLYHDASNESVASSMAMHLLTGSRDRLQIRRDFRAVATLLARWLLCNSRLTRVLPQHEIHHPIL